VSIFYFRSRPFYALFTSLFYLGSRITEGHITSILLSYHECSYPDARIEKYVGFTGGVAERAKAITSNYRDLSSRMSPFFLISVHEQRRTGPSFEPNANALQFFIVN
jgi:hypothetical protein